MSDSESPLLSESQTTVLRHIEERNGLCNWYQTTRALSDLFMNSPEFLSWNYVADGLVLETLIEGEPLPKLSLSEKGREALNATQKK